MGEDQELDDNHYTGNQLTNGIEQRSNFLHWETSIVYKPRTGKDRVYVIITTICAVLDPWDKLFYVMCPLLCRLVGTQGTPGVLMNHLPKKANCKPVKIELTDGIHLLLWFQATQYIDAHAEIYWDYGIGSFFHVPI
jgi:hypothetical protein